MHILIVTTLISILSCSPVRTGNFVERNRLPEVEQTEVKRTPTPEKNQDFVDDRFKDTSVIVMPIAKPVKKISTLNEIFEDAVNEFDQEIYKSACEKFESFTGLINKNDSLYFEALFYKSECYILNNNFVDSKDILELLYKNKQTPKNITEKLLVRLGQIYCALDRKKDAQLLFDRLKKEYPKSIYLKLADCGIIK